jgi:SAM-dependent methyltransferase
MARVSDHARAAYDAFAPDYDDFTAHHDYEQWMADLERFAVGAGLGGTRLLDVACGTGKSFGPLLARGYDVTACDVSPGMLAVAEAKAGGRARLSVQDMRSLPVLGRFDLVTCLDDAINYLHEPHELVEAFAGFARNLAPGGVLLFDANSLHTYETFFASLSVVAEPDRVLVWRGRCPVPLAPGGLAPATVEALRRSAGGGWTSTTHEHRQRHHPRRRIESALAAAGLAVLRIGGMRSDGTLHDGFDERVNTKAIYAAGHAQRPGMGTHATPGRSTSTRRSSASA